MGAGGATRLTKRHKTPRRKLSSSSRLILPSSQAVASAVTMFPRSIAVAKIRRGCPCAVTAPFRWGRTASANSLENGRLSQFPAAGRRGLDVGLGERRERSESGAVGGEVGVVRLNAHTERRSERILPGHSRSERVQERGKGGNAGWRDLTRWSTATWKRL